MEKYKKEQKMKNKLEKSNKFTKNKKTSQIDTTNDNNKTVSLSDDKYHPMYDIIFQRWMSNRKVCESFLIALLNKPITLTEKVKTQEVIVHEDLHGRGIRLDISAQDANYIIYNIEAQRTYIAKSHTNRCVYYACRQISMQLSEGEDFDKLKPVVVIFINLHSDKKSPFLLGAQLIKDYSFQSLYSNKLRILEVNLDHFTDSKDDIKISDDLKFFTVFCLLGHQPSALKKFCEKYNIIYNTTLMETLINEFQKIIMYPIR